MTETVIVFFHVMRDATSKYTETLNAVAPEDLWEIEKERRNIRYGGRTELIQKLYGKYDNRFNRRQYDLPYFLLPSVKFRGREEFAKGNLESATEFLWL